MSGPEGAPVAGPGAGAAGQGRRRRWQPRSLRGRLLLLLALGLLVSAGVVGGVTWRSVLAETEALFDYQLRQMALSLRDQGAVAPEQAEALADDQLDFVVQVWTLDGRTVYSNRQHAALPDRAVLGLADVKVQGETWRSYAVLGPGRVIQVAQPARIRRELATAAALNSVAPIAWIALPMAALVWLLVAQGLRPLQHLADGLRRRDANSLQPLPPDPLPEELSPLVGALNGLLARLEQALAAQRAFVADAAHELRSPLTALKLQWQLLRRAPDEASRAEAVAALGAGIERAARLVEQLLVLARSEPGAHAAPTAPAPQAGARADAPSPAGSVAWPCVDLAEIARTALVDTLAQAQQRHTTLALEAPAPAWVAGDAAALTALVRNLADNAVRYSPDASQVLLSVQPVSAPSPGVLLQVDDSGPGIPPEERERVFDRFYRGAAAHDTTGSGLGLAIVRSVAQRHGAEVVLEAAPLGGLRVSVRFAQAAPPQGLAASG